MRRGWSQSQGDVGRWKGKVMMTDQLYRAEDPGGGNTPSRTSAGCFVDPDKMADSTEALKERKRQRSGQGLGRRSPSSSPHLHLSTQYCFP